MPEPRDPIRQTDDEARLLARQIIAGAGYAALATLDPASGAPWVSRVAIAPGPAAGLFTLISGLAPHTRALAADPRCSLLVGEPGAKGDPLTHPRLTLTARARFVADADERKGLRAHWLARNPKATVYIDLPDFTFVELIAEAGSLNGGFARAWRLAPADMGL